MKNNKLEILSYLSIFFVIVFLYINNQRSFNKFISNLKHYKSRAIYIDNGFSTNNENDIIVSNKKRTLRQYSTFCHYYFRNIDNIKINGQQVYRHFFSVKHIRRFGNKWVRMKC